MEFFSLFTLTAAWIGYFCLHSLLASNATKNRVYAKWPNFERYYRLFYNFVAISMLLPIAWLLHSSDWQPLWQWQGNAQWLAHGLGLMSLIIFAYSLWLYKGMDFVGLDRALNKSRKPFKEVLTISPLHRFVRHPWYFLALVLIWTRDMHSGMLLTATLATLYFIVGSTLEERKLALQFGRAYEDYCRQVPGLIPLPWKWISREQARAIEQSGREG